MAETKKGHSVTLTAHGDGSYHTEEHGHGGSYEVMGRDVSRKDHKSFGEAMMHIAKHHGPEGDHMHIHGHADGYTTHHVMEDGGVEGPDEHDGIRELKRHVTDTMEED